MTVFNELARTYRRQQGPDAVKARALVIAAVARGEEIAEVRRDRARMRAAETRRPEIQMATIVLDLHPLELEACKMLCPDLRKGDSMKKGWQWVLRQPWAEEFKPPGMAQRYY